MWLNISAIYISIGLILVLFTPIRKVISSALGDLDRDIKKKWKVYAIKSLVQLSSVLLWPIFLKSWFAEIKIKQKSDGIFDLDNDFLGPDVNDNFLSELLNENLLKYPKVSLGSFSKKITKAGLRQRQVKNSAPTLNFLPTSFWIEKLGLKKIPNQVEVLQYAIETNYGEWKKTKKSPKRMRDIQIIAKEIRETHWRKIEENKKFYVAPEDTSIYDDRLDWDQQSDEFYNSL